MTLTDQQFKDQCLIIVGNGGEPDEILAKRRLRAGGRLAHFQTKGLNDDRVTCRFQEVEESEETFTWQPPRTELGISKFGKKFEVLPARFWTKFGPDAIELQPTHTLTILTGANVKMKHIVITDEDGTVLVEMSGDVVLNPDKNLAVTYLVDVEDPECHAFGCFSWRFVRLAIVIQLFWHLAKFLLSIYFEQEAVEGKPPWSRNLLAAFEPMPTFSMLEMPWQQWQFWPSHQCKWQSLDFAL
eukprot:symbB.v1.2.038040.t1/scaffold5791.1/size23574/2